MSSDDVARGGQEELTLVISLHKLQLKAAQN